MANSEALERETARREARHRAENMLLACFMHGPEALDECAGLTPEHFSNYPARLVFLAIREQHQKQLPAGPAEIAERLYARGEINDVGYAWLGELWEATGAAAGWRMWFERVMENHLLRRIGELGRFLADRAESPIAPASDLLRDAEREIFSLAEVGCTGRIYTLAEALDLASDRIDQTTVGGHGIVPALGNLGSVVAKFAPGELIIVAARPGVGKTAIALALARNMSTEGKRVLFCSLEQSRDELALRLMLAESGVKGERVRHGSLEEPELDSLLLAKAALYPLPFFVDDASQQDCLRIAAAGRRTKRAHGLDVLMVDYLQLVSPEDRRSPRHEQVGAISRRLKGIARELQVPLISLAQLNRQSEARADSRPKLSDLRESGSIEADADTVILLHQEQGSRELTLIIPKQRSGPVGECRTFFDRSRMRFDHAEASPFPVDESS